MAGQIKSTYPTIQIEIVTNFIKKHIKRIYALYIECEVVNSMLIQYRVRLSKNTKAPVQIG